MRIADELLEAAPRGWGRTLVIEGPAGIGKSALVRDVRERAADAGFTVLAARGAELERDFSFGVVRQLYEPVLAAAGDGERDGLLAGPAALAERAIGQVDSGPEDPPAPRWSSRDPSFAVLHGLFWLTSNMAERAPLTLAVDDAHWADGASLRFLSFLAGRLEGLRVILVVGLRPFEPGAPRELITALEREESSLLVRLAPLTAAGTTALVRARLGARASDGFASACHRATGGNPQLIRELLVALAAEGIEPTPAGAERVAELRADRIAASVLARVGGLGEDAVSVAQAVAVLGRDAEPELVAELAGLPLADAGEAIEGLTTLAVFAAGTPLTFVHPIVRTAIYRDLGPAGRADLHARAARLLAASGAGLDSVAAQIVATPAEHDEWRLAQLATAASAALARAAPEAAVAYLERALAESPPREARREALVDLGRALAMLGDQRQSIRRLREARDMTDDPRRAGEIVNLLVRSMLLSRAVPRAIELLDDAIVALPEADRELGMRLETDIAAGSFFSIEAKRAAERRTRRFDDPDDPRTLASTALTVALYGGTAEKAGALARRALEGRKLLRDEGPDSTSVWLAVSALMYSHHLDEVLALVDDWMTEASRGASPFAYTLASRVRAQALYWRGDLADAEADARAFVAGMPEAIGAGPSLLAAILVDQGRVAEAKDALAVADRAELDVAWSFWYPAVLVSRGVVQIADGALEAGCASLEHAGRVLDEWGITTPGPFQWRPAAAEALAALGDQERARELVDAELVSCRRYGSPRALGVALRAAGHVNRDVDALHEAVATLERCDARLEHARALVELGSALRHARQAAAARVPLREGLAIARSCGALMLAERAHEELTTTGARPRKIVRGGVDALTSSERRVARMAADGLSNKEIAQHLFVTVRTVEAHLHHAYQKLGIGSREELGDAFGNSRSEPSFH